VADSITPAPARRRALDARRSRRRRERRVPSSSPAAIRKRRERARRAAGIEVAEIEVRLDQAISALKARDGLTELEAESLTWPEVEREVRLVVSNWIETWAK
jgi:hypothetical protein